jgi:hypothetical protein
MVEMNFCKIEIRHTFEKEKILCLDFFFEEKLRLRPKLTTGYDRETQLFSENRETDFLK